MPDISSSPDWLDKNRARLAGIPLGPRSQATGRVVSVADGIAQVAGLDEVALGALLQFESGEFGFVHGLGPDRIDVVMLDIASGVEAGAAVRDTGDVLRVPVGEALLGRVVDPLGRPLDAGPVPAASDAMPIERPAPTIIDRALVSEPVETGVLVVDSLFALGRGQRELIVGDRSTGKTALATDIIVNQKTSDLICIYVAVGQRTSSVERVVEAVRQHGSPARCVFVVAGSSTPPGLQWIAPFAGMTMAEYFRDRGQHALIVIDDLTQHAATHRELALLTREPPGREAYPGDVFYVHARLLERAAKLAPEKAGGSLTALPIAETEAGNLSAYIPTNLISITDGQIVLNTRLFAAEQRPAVDVGLSVSRVGGKAQPRALRDVSARMRLDYAQFQELEMFTRFGGLSNPRVKAQIERGKLIRALLSQPRYSGMRFADQVALLAAVAEGAMEAFDPAHIPRLRRMLPDWLDAKAPAAVARVQSTGELSEDERAALVAALAELLGSLPSRPEGAE